jgi:hypothetical protein
MRGQAHGVMAAVSAAGTAVVDAAGGHIFYDEIEGDLLEEFAVIIPVDEGDFGDVGEDAAVDEVAAYAGEHAAADGRREGRGREAGDEGVDVFDFVFFEDDVEVADVCVDDVDVFEIGETLLEDFGEVGVAFDGDEDGVGLEAFNDLVGDGSGAGAEFDDDFGIFPVDLFDGGFGERFGGGPDGGDGDSVAEEFGEEEHVVFHLSFVGGWRGAGLGHEWKPPWECLHLAMCGDDTGGGADIPALLDLEGIGSVWSD